MPTYLIKETTTYEVEAPFAQAALNSSQGKQVDRRRVISAGDPELDEHRDLAVEEHEREGECEIDPDAVVSLSLDGGAYVQAWVWVRSPDCPDCGEPINSECPHPDCDPEAERQ